MGSAATDPQVKPGSGLHKTGQIIEDVARYYGMDGDDDWEAWLLRQYQDVIDNLNLKTWRFNLLASSTITATPGDDEITVPDDVWKIYNLRKTDGIDFALTTVRQRDFDMIFSSQAGIDGYPYASVNFNIYRDGTLKLFPTPDGAYEFLLRYFKLIDIPGMEDYLNVPRPYGPVAKYGLLARAAVVMTQDPGYWEGKFQETQALMEASDEIEEDEDIRFKNIEEFNDRANTYMNPAARPRYLDFW